MEVSRQLHTKAALPPGKEPLLSIREEVGWDPVVWRKIPSPLRESNLRTPIVQPVAQRYTDWAITALTHLTQDSTNLDMFGNDTYPPLHTHTHTKSMVPISKAVLITNFSPLGQSKGTQSHPLLQPFSYSRQSMSMFGHPGAKLAESGTPQPPPPPPV
jgi:hypothetical protein